MKKISKYLLMIIMLVAMISCTVYASPKLNYNKKTIKVGSTITLKVSGTSKQITWRSSDSSIATVNSKGVVTGKKMGTATITAKAGNTSMKCEVKVNNIFVNGLSISNKSITLIRGNTFTLKGTISPSNATNKKIKWASNNSSVATVDQNGKIKAISPGTATVTATSQANSKYKASCTVKVVTSAKLTLTGSAVAKGKTMQMKVSCVPYGYAKRFKWTSSNTSVATVDQNGNVKGIKAGTAVIKVTATDRNNISVSATIKVTEPTKIKGLEASFKYKELSKDYTLKTSDFTVKGIYTDGSKKNVGATISMKLNKSQSGNKVTGTYVFTIKASGYEKVIKIPMKSYTVAACNGIRATTTLTEAESINQAVNAPVKVYKKYTDGSEKQTGSYFISAEYDSTNKRYVLTVSSSEDNKTYSTKIYIKQKTISKTVTGIKATSTTKAVSSVNEALKIPLEVYETYSDGSQKKISAYKITASYNSASDKYSVTVKSSDEKFVSTIYLNNSVQKKITGIKASTTVGEVSSVDEAVKIPLDVYEIYSDGSQKKISAYKINASYGSASNKYIVKITSSDGKYVSTIYLNNKTKNELKTTYVSFAASTTIAEVSSEDEALNAPIDAYYLTSDNKKVAIDPAVSVSYDKTGNKYTLTVTDPNGPGKAVLYIAKKEEEKITLSSVSYELNPSYVYTGEGIAPGQLIVTATFSNGEVKDVSSEASNDFVPQQTPGNYAFTVNYQNSSKQMNIEVKEKEKTLTSLNANFKVSYILAEDPITKDMITVTAAYSDGSTGEITDYDLSVTPAPVSGGMATVTVTYKGNSMNIQVKSYSKSAPKSASFSYTQRSIKTGENISRDDITVTIEDFAGNEYPVSDWSIDFTPKDIPGVYPFTITYMGFSESFNVTVA